jgi:hypothetical protein
MKLLPVKFFVAVSMFVLSILVLPMFGLSLLSGVALADAGKAAPYPVPSRYPISWELKFSHEVPARIAVSVPGDPVPEAFWYMTYSVVNPIQNDPNKDQERPFFPEIEMVTSDGKVIRSDDNIPLAAFDAIKLVTKNSFLLNYNKLPTTIRLGEDQQIDGVAIWREPMLRMGAFNIFVSGMSGEFTTVPGPDGQPVILHKTLQLNFHINGDEVNPGQEPVVEDPSEWVMR